MSNKLDDLATRWREVERHASSRAWTTDLALWMPLPLASERVAGRNPGRVVTARPRARVVAQLELDPEDRIIGSSTLDNAVVGGRAGITFGADVIEFWSHTGRQFDRRGRVQVEDGRPTSAEIHELDSGYVALERYCYEGPRVVSLDLELRRAGASGLETINRGRATVLYDGASVSEITVEHEWPGQSERTRRVAYRGRHARRTADSVDHVRLADELATAILEWTGPQLAAIALHYDPELQHELRVVGLHSAAVEELGGLTLTTLNPAEWTEGVNSDHLASAWANRGKALDDIDAQTLDDIARRAYKAAQGPLVYACDITASKLEMHLRATAPIDVQHALKL